MERPNAVAALRQKRDELRKELAAAEKAVRNIRVDLDHLDATLRLFTDDAPRAIPRHEVAHRAKRGETQRHVLKMLREASGPITSEEVAQAWCEARGLQADHDTYVLFRKRIGACLNGLKRKGMVSVVPMSGAFSGWLLTQQNR